MKYQEAHPGYEELTSDDVRLIQPDLEHAEPSLLWVKDNDVVQYMGADFPAPTVEGERARIQEILENKDEYSWMIEMDGAVIGNVCINSIQESTQKYGQKSGNLTFLIGDKNFWGKGIATKACEAVLDWARRDGFQVMFARALQENTGSMKTLVKLGFKPTTTEPYEGLVAGKPSVWYNFELKLLSES